MHARLLLSTLFILLAMLAALAEAQHVLRPDRSMPPGRYVGEMIVYTAHQDWMSRVYLLRMDGSVIGYFHYDYYFLADTEVVNNEVYIAEAFAPRGLKLDLDTGDLQVIIDDWSLYYFYDLAFDDTYFYVTEWDLNRYDIDGNKDGMASFDEDVYGGAWDGVYYWTLTDEAVIKCWDISAWPTLVELPANAFAPPTPACCGLWFDGRYFWSAENIDGQLGYIYQFDYNGKVLRQWLEPAFRGWSACAVIRHPALPGDFNDDCFVNLTDFTIFAEAYLSQLGDPNWNPLCDMNTDGHVNLTDFTLFADVYGTSCE